MVTNEQLIQSSQDSFPTHPFFVVILSSAQLRQSGVFATFLVFQTWKYVSIGLVHIVIFSKIILEEMEITKISAENRLS